MSQRPMHSPLDDTHLAQINRAAPFIEKAAAQIALAKRAGVDVGDAEQKLTKHADTLNRIKQTYFPGE